MELNDYRPDPCKYIHKGSELKDIEDFVNLLFDEADDTLVEAKLLSFDSYYDDRAKYLMRAAFHYEVEARPNDMSWENVKETLRYVFFGCDDFGYSRFRSLNFGSLAYRGWQSFMYNNRSPFEVEKIRECLDARVIYLDVPEYQQEKEAWLKNQELKEQTIETNDEGPNEPPFEI